MNKSNNVKINNVGTTSSRPHFEESAKKRSFNKGAVSEADWGFSNKGITLIALIITIIVLMILAAVLVDVTVDGKLFDKAQHAVDTTNDKISQQQGRVDELMTEMDKIEEKQNELKSGETVLEEEKATEGNTTLTVKLLSTKELVTADGTKVSSITEGAPIPVDFYYVGGTMNTGIVISDNSADKNLGVDAELAGNQFVWVPVAQNQRIEIEIETDAEITALTIKDPVLEEITTDKNGNTISPSGTSYTVTVNPTINGLYTVTVTAGEETVEKTLRVSSLYEQDFWNVYYMTEEYAKASGYENLQELLEDWYGEGATIENGLEDVEWCLDYTDSTIATHSNSVNTYGGFYIARYEAGSENARTRSSGTTDTVYSKKNMYPYNYISQTDTITKASGMYNKTNVTSSLVNAAAWNRTLNWLVETNAITANEILVSTNWGNYYNSTFDFTGKYYTVSWKDATSSTLKPVEENYPLGTGVSDYTKRNNIYDLAGNCWEWTIEAHSSGYVFYRGGSYDDDGDGFPASYRSYDDATHSARSVAFRTALYIN